MSLSDSSFILFGMNDTARDSTPYQPADTIGLDDLFDPNLRMRQGENPNKSHETNFEILETAEIVTETNEIPVETVSLTVQEAIKLLGIPRSTVYRHVRSGKYRTLQGLDGKLRIQLRQDEIPNKSQETAFETLETAEIVAETNEIPVENANAVVDIDALFLKLEAASYRIGFLEAQLETERQQVKLLTDSQHQQGWWSRFSAWFIGRKP